MKMLMQFARLAGQQELVLFEILLCHMCDMLLASSTCGHCSRTLYNSSRAVRLSADSSGLRYFYEEQLHCMELMSQEPICGKSEQLFADTRVLQYFHEEQLHRMELMSQEPVCGKSDQLCADPARAAVVYEGQLHRMELMP